MRIQARTLGIALVALAPALTFAQPADQQAQAAPQDPVAQYESLLRQIRGLQQFNALRARQIQAQERRIADIETAIEGVPELERELPPLLIEMVNGLDTFVSTDVPFLLNERNDRIANLYNLIEEADTNDVAKLRRILEAWSIEAEYGGAFNTDTGMVEIDGAERQVDFFILGRVGLLFQTSDDEAITGAWDSRNNSWVILGSEHRNPVRQAIRMARNQIAPELVLLPTLPPQLN
jgi:hypothetical protein